jgi:DNA-binding Xre family transcriptional regulator
MTIPPEITRTKLEALLTRKKITQAQLFSRIKSTYKIAVPKYLISRIVSGTQPNFHINTLYKICRTLGVSPNDVLDYEEVCKINAKRKKQ